MSAGSLGRAAFVLMLLFPAMGQAEESAPVFTPYRHPVMTWVPPYGLARSKARLRGPDAGPLPAQALTHVALQFWVPTSEGGARVTTRFDPITDEVIGEWRDWCHAQGLRALLCVYNGEEKWDWGLARDAFAGHRAEFARALLAEVERLSLDGLDLDLEGDGAYDADKAAFIELVGALSAELHPRGKQLFVDSFAYIWNAPNQHWWPELFPLVDGLSSMGYEETGVISTGWRNYSAQTAAAGHDVSKLLIGVPTHLAGWQESLLLDQLQGLQKANGPGVALWDAQFRAPAWTGEEPWKVLREIRGGK